MKTCVKTGVKTGVPAGYVQGTAAARTRDVERDSMLKTALSAAPPNTTSVWLRGYEVRMEAASTAVEANGRSGGRKRSRRGTTLAVESDDLSLRRSGRRCVIVL